MHQSEAIIDETSLAMAKFLNVKEKQVMRQKLKRNQELLKLFDTRKQNKNMNVSLGNELQYNTYTDKATGRVFCSKEAAEAVFLAERRIAEHNAKSKPVKNFASNNPSISNVVNNSQSDNQSSSSSTSAVEVKKVAPSKPHLIPFLRQNIENLDDIASMSSVLFEENSDIRVVITKIEWEGGLQKITNNTTCPINGVLNPTKDDSKPKYYLGWRGKISGKICNPDGSINHRYSVGDIFSKTNTIHHYNYSPPPLPFHIEGIRVLSGIACNPFTDIQFEIFLDDFPLLLANFQKLCGILPEVGEYNKKLIEMEENIDAMLSNDQELVRLDSHIREILTNIKALRTLRSEMITAKRLKLAEENRIPIIPEKQMAETLASYLKFDFGLV